MSALDVVFAWVGKLLGLPLPDGAVEVLWLPVFFVLLVIMLRLVLRKGVPAASRLGQSVLRAAVAVLAVPVMALLVAVATPFRGARRNPPGVLFTLDDGLVAAATGTLNGIGKAVVVAQKASRTHILLILLLAGALVWRWDAGVCTRQPSGQCARPLLQWAQTVGLNSEGQSPDPSPSQSPQPSP